MHLHQSSSRTPVTSGLNPRDVAFVDMLRAFRRTGGLARGEVFLERRLLLARASPARTEGEPIICFEWNDKLWLPWFQFDPETLNVLPGPASIIRELMPVFDGWALASWLAQPNLWLGGERPIDTLDVAIAEVLRAARADRFIAAG